MISFLSARFADKPQRIRATGGTILLMILAQLKSFVSKDGQQKVRGQFSGALTFADFQTTWAEKAVNFWTMMGQKRYLGRKRFTFVRCEAMSECKNITL